MTSTVVRYVLICANGFLVGFAIRSIWEIYVDRSSNRRR